MPQVVKMFVVEHDLQMNIVTKNSLMKPKFVFLKVYKDEKFANNNDVLPAARGGLDY